MDPARISILIGQMQDEATQLLRSESVSPERMSIAPELDMRFRGQETSLGVPLGDDRSPEGLREQFLAAYRAVYSYSSNDAIETVSVRLTARGIRPGRIDFGAVSTPASRDGVTKLSKRDVFFDRGSDPTRTPILDRHDVAGTVSGPVILEGTDSTVVIPPGAVGTVDERGNLMITIDAQKAS
jgi:N-methylhydantoinase A